MQDRTPEDRSATLDRGYRAVFRDQVGRAVWAAAAVSLLGDYIGQGALFVLAFQRTGGRALGPALIFAATALPALFTGILGGGLIDRVSRTRALVASHLVGAAAILLPFVIDGLAGVLVAAALLGVVKAATVSTRAAILSEAVSSGLRGRVIALISTNDQVGQVLGYLTGAGLAVGIGAESALLADCATFLIGILIIGRLRLPTPQVREHYHPLGGFTEIFRHERLRRLAPVVWLSAIPAALPETLASRATLDSPELTGLVMASGPLGFAIATWVVGRSRRLTSTRFQMGHLAWLALALGSAVAAPNVLWLAVANALIGSGVAWMIGPQVTFVETADPARMGQVTGTMVATLIVVEGVATPGLAALADGIGLGAAYAAASIAVATLVAGWFVAEFRASRRPADVDGLVVAA